MALPTVCYYVFVCSRSTADASYFRLPFFVCFFWFLRSGVFNSWAVGPFPSLSVTHLPTLHHPGSCAEQITWTNGAKPHAARGAAVAQLVGKAANWSRQGWQFRSQQPLATCYSFSWRDTEPGLPPMAAVGHRCLWMAPPGRPCFESHCTPVPHSFSCQFRLLALALVLLDSFTPPAMSSTLDAVFVLKEV